MVSDRQVVYEVTLSVDADIFEDMKKWLLEHVPDLVNLDGFIQADVCEPLEISQEDLAAGKRTIRSRYLLKSKAAMDNYLQKHATKFRQEGIDRFGNKFAAKRQMWHLENTFFPKN